MPPSYHRPPTTAKPPTNFAPALGMLELPARRGCAAALDMTGSHPPEAHARGAPVEGQQHNRAAGAAQNGIGAGNDAR